MKISPNEQREEKNRVHSGNYRQFLKKLQMINLRGFTDETVEFRYPVTALIGTNGGGKSTILGACGTAYKDIKPGQFFPKASIGDDSMADWQIRYEIIDKEKSRDKAIERSARFKESRWRRDDPPSRNVVYIEIQRTVPASELTKFRKFLSGNENKAELTELSPDTIKYATAILDKDISHYRLASLHDSDTRMYVGRSGEKNYSQFHFGAGEASIIATVDRIETAGDNSLILIEEIENGLHPVAVRLMINYLENVARRKRHQIVFTTHSQDAVDQLPSEAIWASINKKVWSGQLSIESLRAISGQIPDERVIFVEDEFVKAWVENAIRRYRNELTATTKVYTAGGYPAVLKVCEFHNKNPHIKIPATALVDGDIYKPDDGDKLPEYARYLGDKIPESEIFEFIHKNREELAGLIRQRCLLANHNQQKIVDAIESVHNSACDAHQYYDNLGDKLDFASGLSIRNGMIDIFNERNEDLWRPIFDFIENAVLNR